MRISRNPYFDRLGRLRKYPRPYVPRPRFEGRLPSPQVFCPEAGREIAFAFCQECPEFRVWDAQDGDFRRCRHEYLSLEAKGYYDGTWDDHPENFDPETFERLQEEKRTRERVLREMEAEKNELVRMAEALEKEFPPSCSSDRFWPDDADEDDESDEPDPTGEDDDDGH